MRRARRRFGGESNRLLLGGAAHATLEGEIQRADRGTVRLGGREILGLPPYAIARSARRPG